MPLGDGTGPPPGAGGAGAGPEGSCAWGLACGEKAAHVRGTPCYQQKCPKCSGPMTRER